MTWIRSLTTILCAAESGTVGISLSWEKSSQTTWLTAKLSAELVKKKKITRLLLLLSCTNLSYYLVILLWLSCPLALN